MREKPNKPASSDADNEPMSVEKFRQWIQDPNNAKEWHKFLTEVKPPEVPADAPPEMVAALRAISDKRRAVLAVSTVKQKLAALQAVITRPPGTMLAEERLAECRALENEITDALLETTEPHRSILLKRFLPIREQIRALRLES